MTDPLTNLYCVSRSLEVLREMLEIPRDQWDDGTFLRAHAHLSVVRDNAKELAEWCKYKDFMKKATT